MKLILAVASDDVEAVFTTSLSSNRYVSKLKSSEELVKKCREHQPDMVVLFGYITGLENLSVFKTTINEMTNSEFSNMRVVVFFGKKEHDTHLRVDHCISRGIYDYHYIDPADPNSGFSAEDVIALVTNRRSRSDCLKDIIDDVAVSSANTIQVHEVVKKEVEEKIVYLEKTKAVTLKQQIITVGGSGGSGVTSFVFNFSAHLATLLKDVPNADILVIDYDMKKPDLTFMYKSKEEAENYKSLLDLIPKLNANTLNYDDVEKILIQPYKNYPNLKLLSGNVHYSNDHKQFEESALVKLINVVKSKHHIILLNTSGDLFDRHFKNAYNNSNLCFYIVQPQAAALSHAKMSFLKFRNDSSINYNDAGMHLIMNMGYPSEYAEVADYAKVLHINSYFKIDYYGNDFKESMNQRKPYVFKSGDKVESFKSDYSKISDLIYIPAGEEKATVFTKILNKLKIR
jgi:MinD-like ATPase involved in chromosome partitioning or flagellar assembly